MRNEASARRRRYWTSAMLVTLLWWVAALARPDQISRASKLSLPGRAQAIAVKDDRAYLGLGTAGLVVVDIARPESPRLLGGVDTPGQTEDIEISGHLAVVADGESGRLLVIDAAQPQTPKIVGSCQLYGYPKSVKLAGSLAYVANLQRGLQVVDLADPAHPAQIFGERGPLFAVNYLPTNVVQDIALGDHRLFACGAARIDVYDTTDPRQPVYLGTQKKAGSPTRLASKGGWLWGLDAGNYINAYYARPAEALARISQYAIWETNWSNPETARSLSLEGDTAIVTLGTQGAQVVDLSDPLSLMKRVTFETEGEALDAALAGDYCYVANGAAGLWIGQRYQIQQLRLIEPVVLRPGLSTAVRCQWTGPGYGVNASCNLYRFVPDQHWPQSSFALERSLFSNEYLTPAPRAIPLAVDESFAGKALRLELGSAAASQYALVNLVGTTDTLKPVLTIADDPITSRPSGVVTLYGLAFDQNAIQRTVCQRVEVRLDEGPWQLANYHHQYTWWTTATLTRRTHVLWARAVDYAANVQETSRTLAVGAQDYIAPTVRITQPAEGQVLTGVRQIEVRGMASDVSPISSGVLRVLCSANGVNATVAGKENWSALLSLRPGENWITATVEDPTGNLGRTTVRVFYQPTDQIAPVVTIHDPQPGQAVERIVASGKATDQGSGLERIEARLNGGRWVSLGAGPAWSQAWAAPPNDGPCALEVRAIDRSGNVSPVAYRMIHYSPPRNIQLTSVLGGPVGKVALKGKIAYVAEGPNVRIIDLADPQHVRVLGSYYGQGQIVDLALEDSLLYALSDQRGLHILDVSDPARPALKSCYLVSGKPQALSLQDKLAFIGYSENKVCIVDAADPAKPALQAEIDPASDSARVPLCGTNTEMGLLARDGRLYVMRAGGDLAIYDVATPSQPRLVGLQYLSSSSSSNKPVLFMAGSVLYVNLGNYKHVLDVSAPQHPRVLPTDNQSWFKSYYHDLVLSGSAIYAVRTDRLDVLEFSPFELPHVVRSYRLPPLAYPMGWRTLALEGTQACVASEQGLQLIDLTASPLGTDYLGAAYDAHGPILDGSGPMSPSSPVAAQGKLVFTVGDSGLLRVFDTTNLANPVQIGSAQLLPSSPAYKQETRRVLASGNRLYVAHSYSLSVVDVTDPTSPTVLARCPSQGYIMDALGTGELVFVCEAVQSPERASQISAYSFSKEQWGQRLKPIWLPPDSLMALGLHGSILAGAHRYNGRPTLFLFDTSNPAELKYINPGELEHTMGATTRILGEGNRLFLAMPDKMIKTLDLSNPAQIKPASSYPADMPRISALSGETLVAGQDGDPANPANPPARLTLTRLRPDGNCETIEQRPLPCKTIQNLALAGSRIYAVGEAGLMVLRDTTANAAQITCTLPAVASAGETLTATLRVRNTGRVAWTARDGYRLSLWEGMRHPPVLLPLPAGLRLLPGQEVVFTRPVRLPSATTHVSMSAAMEEEGTGEPFATLPIEIDVLGAETTPTLSAQYVACTAPSTLRRGEAVLASLTLRNSGNLSWRESSRIRLSCIENGGGLWDEPTRRIYLPATTVVKPGDAYRFEFGLRAPRTAGTYRLRLQMVQEGASGFGPVQEITVKVSSETAPLGGLPLNAEVVGYTLPTPLVAGRPATIRVTLRNTGTQPWTATSGCRLRVWKDPARLCPQADPYIALAPSAQVAMGQTCSFEVPLLPPRQAGAFNFELRMAQGTQALFGELLRLEPQVEMNNAAQDWAAYQ